MAFGSEEALRTAFLSKVRNLNRNCSRQAMDSLNKPESANQHFQKNAAKKMQ